MKRERTVPQDRRRLESLPDLLTRTELAEFTGISPATFARWAMTGEGPTLTKLGRAARYRKAAVVAWLDGSAAVTLKSSSRARAH